VKHSLHPEALEEYLGAMAYYADISPHLAESFINACLDLAGMTSATLHRLLPSAPGPFTRDRACLSQRATLLLFELCVPDYRFCRRSCTVCELLLG
jgi:hypothetical protein